MNQLHHDIALSKRELNKLAPISCLPKEIFSEFLDWCMVLGTDHIGIYKEVDYARQAIINVSHTCHSWRSFALSYPKVWTIIRSHCVSYLDASIERSQTLPLRVLIHKDGVSPVLLHHLYRVTELEIRGDKIDLWDSLEAAELVPQDLLLLNKLTLVDRSIDVWSDEVATFNMPQWFLSRNLPDLRHLTIQNDLDFEWWRSRDYPSNLTQLCIRLLQDDWEPDDRCSMADILTWLKYMTLLESLELEGVLPGGVSIAQMELVSHSTRIHMPHLKHLTLEGPLMSIIYLFNHLHLPSTTVVHLAEGFDPSGDRHEYLASLVPFIKPLLSGRSASGVHSEKPLVLLGIDFGRRTGVHDITYSICREFVNSAQMIDTHSNLTLDIWSWEPHSALKIISMFREEAMDELLGVEALSLGQIDPMDRDIFLKMFRCCNKLRWLELTNVNALLFPNILLADWGTPGTDGYCDHLFPNLETITVSWVTFRGSNMDGVENDIYFIRLYDAIVHRKQNNLGPTKIIFEQPCNISETDEAFKQLSSLVTVVIREDIKEKRPDDAGTYNQFLNTVDATVE